MKYISKRHLIVLLVIVAVLGALLLLGERFARFPEVDTDHMVPPTQVTTDAEPLLYGRTDFQQQLKSQSYIIRPGQSKLTYSEALDLYKNNLLQFNENCQLSSGVRSFNLKNEVMIDNRSSKANSFVVGSTLIAIAPYDFAFMILKEKGDAVPVQCGSQKNVSTISVQ